VYFAQKFDGINWKMFVRLMNRFRKTGTYLKIDNNASETVLNDGFGSGAFSSAPVDAGGLYDDYGNYGNEDDYEGGEAETLIDIDGDLSRQERLKEEFELNKFQSFYNIVFTQRLLQSVNLIASISTKTAFASHIMFSIAHPQRIATLLSILVLGNPQMKILSVKILEHLILILPPELFEESVTLITSGPEN